MYLEEITECPLTINGEQKFDKNSNLKIINNYDIKDSINAISNEVFFLGIERDPEIDQVAFNSEMACFVD